MNETVIKVEKLPSSKQLRECDKFIKYVFSFIFIRRKRAAKDRKSGNIFQQEIALQ